MTLIKPVAAVLLASVKVGGSLSAEAPTSTHYGASDSLHETRAITYSDSDDHDKLRHHPTTTQPPVDYVCYINGDRIQGTNGVRYVPGVYGTFGAITYQACCELCFNDRNCKAFNFESTRLTSTCELFNGANFWSSDSNLVINKGWTATFMGTDQK
ncbi:hypothetical protein ON010_g12590 [Phytophthora cinnamomi]|nr:hypothetical protein ON010_g12590 [Phytophthora cinnamomi]